MGTIYFLTKKLLKLPVEYFPENMQSMKKSDSSAIEIHEFLEANLDRQKLYSLEKLIQLSNFFSYWYELHRVTQKTELSQTKIKAELKLQGLSSSKYRVVKVLSKPDVILISFYVNETQTVLDKLSTPHYFQLIVYYVPKYQICFIKPLNGSKHPEIMETVTKTLGKLNHVNFRALDMSRVYNSAEKVHKMSLKATQQITGIPGLQKLNFVGEDVKSGLLGLYQRQDVFSKLSRIGPKMHIETDDLCIKVGKTMRIKNHRSLKAIDELLKAME